MSVQLNTLIEAIQAIYNPNTTNDTRITASQLIESAKETNETQQVAFELISNDNLFIAVVGWNFIEHIIKFKWLELNCESRLTMRNNCFLEMCSDRMRHSELRNASSRCIVAMIEHEWPQNWPELFDQLDQLSCTSTIHAQLPFIILQRLIEDVITMGTVENVSRRRELNNAISLRLSALFQLSISTLIKCSQSTDADSVLLARCAICLLSEIVEWVSAKVLEPFLNDILKVICEYLKKPQLSIYEFAARCLWRLSSRRRAKNDENIIVVALFGDLPMKTILDSAVESANVNAENVEHYRYLKVICDILSALGTHLCDVWQKEPPNFDMFLLAVDAFFQHPSLYLRNESSNVLVSFMSDAKICHNQMFSELTSRIIIEIPKLIQKIGLPSSNDSSSCAYSQIDYDDDMQFMHDFIQFRDRCIRIIRYACADEKHAPNLCKIVEDWIRNRCISSPQCVSEMEWDAMQRYSRTVLSGCHEEKHITEQQMNVFTDLFDGVLSQISTSTDITLINRLLSVVSSLFIILTTRPDRLSSFLIQIRRLLVDVVDDDKTMKRHCLSVLLRLITAFSDAVKDQAESILELCLSVRNSLSLMQQATCTHLLAALSNLCVDFNVQHNFLVSTLHDSIAFFSSSQLIDALKSDAQFLSYIGFTSQAPLTNDDAQLSLYVSNRRYKLHPERLNVSVIVSLTRLDYAHLRSHLSAVEGVLTQVRSISPPLHPAFSIIQPILPIIFSLVERLNSLHRPQTVNQIHHSYGPTVIEITDSDRQQLISAIDPLSVCSSRISTEDPRDHARCFISDITDSIQSITGLLASKMANELFAELSLHSWLLQLVSHIDVVPDFRIRFWIKRSWRPISNCCPESAYNKIRAMFIKILSEIQTRLQARWEQLAHVEICEEPSLEQLYNEHMVCVLTRECVNLLRSILNISDSSSSAPSSNHDDKKEDPICFVTAQIGQDKEAVEMMVALSFSCLTCRDTTSSIRIAPVCKALVDFIKNMSTHGECVDGIAVFMLVTSIKTLQIHGSDEAALGPLLSLIFHIYYSLRKCCNSLLRVLEQVPECSRETLESFDSRIIAMISNNEFVVEKVKREIIKKLLKPLIALSIGEQHKRPVHLRSLPPLAKRVKPLIDEDFTALALIFNNND